ncbi:hypothetical protein GCM10010145_54470 [Streptomyces ruber]|uniref:Uncharacterized protein n=2 Tax=Streptomyces TaxID=1883 RepID=A0A918EXS0_9ACTN|nr:hypothetical protein [Streptomyces ruber]GGQ77805.1 hypothetical protein GCM10010145_54470 [Streptomyces ruber]
MSEPKPSVRHGRSLARTMCATVLLFVITIAGPTIAQATEAHSAHHPPARYAAVAGDASSNEVIDEIKKYIADLVREFAAIVKPNVSVQFGVTVAVTLVGGYTLFKVVFNARGRRHNDCAHHGDHHVCRACHVCHACHGTHHGHW